MVSLSSSERIQYFLKDPFLISIQMIDDVEKPFDVTVTLDSVSHVAGVVPRGSSDET